MIEKLKDTGCTEWPYIDPDGVSHRSKSDYLQSEMGFCGCGYAYAVMKYVYEMLKQINDKRFEDYENKPYMFFCYWADHFRLTDHGTTARCSWLTDKGKEFLKDMEWCLENEPGRRLRNRKGVLNA